MKPGLLMLLLAALPGCLVVRGGGGASFRGDSTQAPGTFDAEVGMLVPLPREGDEPTWVASALAIVRGRTSSDGWSAAGLELARSVGRRSGEPGSPDCLGLPAGSFLAGRVEVGRDDVGRYLGGALVARRYLAVGGGCPLLPSVSLVLNAGAYLGPVHGPAVGLHLLVGFN